MQILAAVLVFLASATLASSTVLPYYTNSSGYELQTGPLDTPWTAEVGTNPWPEHPRPRVQRSQWKNLNGVWRWRNVTAGQVNSPPSGQTLERAVLVPSCLESALSGMSSHLISALIQYLTINRGHGKGTPLQLVPDVIRYSIRLANRQSRVDQLRRCRLRSYSLYQWRAGRLS